MVCGGGVKKYAYVIYGWSFIAKHFRTSQTPQKSLMWLFLADPDRELSMLSMAEVAILPEQVPHLQNLRSTFYSTHLNSQLHVLLAPLI